MQVAGHAASIPYGRARALGDVVKIVSYEASASLITLPFLARSDVTSATLRPDAPPILVSVRAAHDGESSDAVRRLVGPHR